MSKEHWHAGSRSDHITALALARSNAETQGRSGSHPKHDKHTPKRLPPSAIPDLRFEPTYLAKLSAAGSGWRSVVYITVRDQVINPLLQGVLWGTATVFIQPLLRPLIGWWSKPHTTQPPREGSAAGWLRRWARSLFPEARPGIPSGIR